MVIPRGGFALFGIIELLKFQITNTKYQKNSNDRNSKSQTMSRPKRFWSRAAQALAPRVEYWNLRPARSCLAMAGGFIWNLPARRFFGGVLGICGFRQKTLRQRDLSLTLIRGPGFQYFKMTNEQQERNMLCCGADVGQAGKMASDSWL